MVRYEHRATGFTHVDDPYPIDELKCGGHMFFDLGTWDEIAERLLAFVR